MIIANDGYYDGNSFDAYLLFGAHPDENGGYHFACYAPNAREIQLIGDFNEWRPGELYLYREQMHGVWTITVPWAKKWDKYKFRIQGPNGEFREHCDPYGYYHEMRPANASVLWDDDFVWEDEAWIAKRTGQSERAINIYEMHFGSWKMKEDGSLYTYRELAPMLIPYLKENHFTHIELLPVSEYPFDGSWGYQITGSFAPTARYGTPEDFKYFVNELHKADIGIIIDYVPIHFAIDSHGLSWFDGSALYEYPDDSAGISQWGTKNFNLYRGEVRSFLKSAAAFWVKELHMDGIRMDAIRNGVYWQGEEGRGINYGALEFFRGLNDGIHARFPGTLLIAEDSSAFEGITWPSERGGLGFDYKWDMGWMHDTLDYMASAPWQRRDEHTKLTFSMFYFYNERYLLPLSHDEVVHGKLSIVNKMWGTYEEKFAQAKSLYTYMFAHPGKKLNFMGNEFAQFREWAEFEQQDWLLFTYPKHQEFLRYFRKLSEIYLNESALHENEYDPLVFEWLEVDNAEEQIFAIQRKFLDDRLIFVMNFSYKTIDAHKLPTDCYGEIEVLADSDAYCYGGTCEGTNGVKYAVVEEDDGFRGFDRSFSVRLGGFSSLVLKGSSMVPEGYVKKKKAKKDDRRSF